MRRRRGYSGYSGYSGRRGDATQEGRRSGRGSGSRSGNGSRMRLGRQVTGWAGRPAVGGQSIGGAARLHFARLLEVGAIDLHELDLALQARREGAVNRLVSHEDAEVNTGRRGALREVV